MVYKWNVFNIYPSGMTQSIKYVSINVIEIGSLADQLLTIIANDDDDEKLRSNYCSIIESGCLRYDLFALFPINQLIPIIGNNRFINSIFSTLISHT